MNTDFEIFDVVVLQQTGCIANLVELLWNTALETNNSALLVDCLPIAVVAEAAERVRSFPKVIF